MFCSQFLKEGFYRWVTMLLVVTSVIILSSNLCYAVKVEKNLGVGGTFFAGKDSSSVLAPPFGAAFSVSANIVGSGGVSYVNRFIFDAGFAGLNLGGSSGPYNTIFGTFNFAFKFDMVQKETVKPYIEIGPLIGFFIVNAPGASDGMNQTALKYGGSIGSGFDWLKAPKRGMEGGWGLAFNFFRYMPSTSFFEFKAGKMAVTGIKFEVRFILSPGI